ncbi:hypothetical protein AVEN_154378-1 [Araneus ventricosus]|uniref:Tc1-like transposase DDE domain-containing protein n=1 Tax=Araneus ventricosus TaxID=182803 RepID=A0A4Y1ZVB6_ARAVE|nr:hypothetical protein AVEN_251443-1 [Araneus ventricosus]GBL69642.1 hypothetical protein AVEN_154378-1 [Araneus ventricosus]
MKSFKRRFFHPLFLTKWEVSETRRQPGSLRDPNTFYEPPLGIVPHIQGTFRKDHQCGTLTKLKSAILRMRPGLLSRGALFLDDNARPNTVRDTKEHIRRLGWERLDDPAYSPALAL